MFEGQQEAVSQLLQSNQSFRRLYDQHHELKSKVQDASTKPTSLDDLEVERMKKEKLLLKDQMADMLRAHQHM